MAPVTFVGRAAELDELSRRVAMTAGGGLSAVAVSAPSGLGKTALLRHAADSVPCARWATATPWETDRPGSVIAQLLQGPSPTDPVAAARALADVLGECEPTLIVVDDAHYADPVSLQALSTLVRHHRTLAALIVAATDGPPVLQDIVSSELVLGGLDPIAVRELASARGHVLAPSMADRLARHTSGNPRHICALLNELAPQTWSQLDVRLPAPAAFVRQVAAAAQQAGRQGADLAFALAVLGDHANLADAVRLAGIEVPLAAVESATAAGLIVAGDPMEPRLRDQLTAAAMLDLRGAYATAVAHQSAAAIVTDPVARLRHRVAATPVPNEVLADEVDALAHASGAVGAWSRAAVLFRDAGRLTADPLRREERLTRAVDALVAAGDCFGAAALVPGVENLRETPLRNAVLAYLAVVRGRATEAELRLQRAWDIVNPVRDPGTAAFIAQRHVLHALVQCQGNQLVAWADRALELADPNSPAGFEAAAIRGLGMLAAGHPLRATAAYNDLNARVRHSAQAQRVAMGRGWVQLVCDDIDAARASLKSAVAAEALGGSSRITLWSHAWLARTQFAMGEWDAALSSVERGRHLAESSGVVLATPLLEWTAGQIAALRGDWTGAAAASKAASAGTCEYAMMRIPALLLRAQIAEAHADYATVRRVLEPLRRMAAGTSLQEPGYWPWVDMLANAQVLDGDLEEADSFLRPHEQRAKARGHRSAQARLGYARGRLLGAMNDIAGARKVFDESLDHLEGLPLRFDTARVNFAYGQMLRRAGKRRAADAAIGTARELFISLGATTYVVRCDRELKAGGLNQTRDSREDNDLTPQEEAVTSLVAQGLSNREVAAELYVSPKTVQYHLTRIYAKLSVRSRSELAALWRRG